MIKNVFKVLIKNDIVKMNDIWYNNNNTYMTSNTNKNISSLLCNDKLQQLKSKDTQKVKLSIPNTNAI